MPIPFEFDFKNPNYAPVFQHRLDRLKQIRKEPALVPGLKKFYKKNIAQFIIDWGTTFEPRNIERGLPATLPFLLFPKQEDCVNWILERWYSQENGLIDKSRDLGLSWITVAISSSLALFNDEIIIGFGSRKEEYIDTKGDPKTLFDKARRFLNNVPVEFRGGFVEKRDAPYMRINIPETRAKMIGEAGDNMGRGNRTSLYFKDESAHFQRPDMVEAAISETTNCAIDISTPKGRNNPFGRKRFSGEVPVFTLHWRDDPRKDEAWYEKRKRMIGDPVIIAQELDLDYSASVEGVVIPAIWVRAAIDAHKILGVKVSGVRLAALDVADQGRDTNAYAGRQGILLEFLEEWTGQNSDIFATTERSFRLSDTYDYPKVYFDSDGIGANVRGDARVIGDRRVMERLPRVDFVPHHGSGAVLDPEDDPFHKKGTPRFTGKGRTNEDFFHNFKAQAWWSLRSRFELTYRAVEAAKKNETLDYDPNEIISLSSKLMDSKRTNLLEKVIAELSQPIFKESKTGKIVIDKLPAGARSPNLADAVMMVFAPVRTSRGFFSVN